MIILVTEKMSVFDDVDSEVLRCYHEMTLANLVYYGLKEGACSEQSARMTAMDAASKNASEFKQINSFNYVNECVYECVVFNIVIR